MGVGPNASDTSKAYLNSLSDLFCDESESDDAIEFFMASMHDLCMIEEEGEKQKRWVSPLDDGGETEKRMALANDNGESLRKLFDDYSETEYTDDLNKSYANFISKFSDSNNKRRFLEDFKRVAMQDEARRLDLLHDQVLRLSTRNLKTKDAFSSSESHNMSPRKLPQGSRDLQVRSRSKTHSEDSHMPPRHPLVSGRTSSSKASDDKDGTECPRGRPNDITPQRPLRSRSPSPVK